MMYQIRIRPVGTTDDRLYADQVPEAQAFKARRKLEAHGFEVSLHPWETDEYKRLKARDVPPVLKGI
jgi:hypothetical protein